jgi:hypothetical protein
VWGRFGVWAYAGMMNDEVAKARGDVAAWEGVGVWAYAGVKNEVPKARR